MSDVKNDRGVRGWGPAVQRPGAGVPAWQANDPLVAPGEHANRQALARVFMNHVFGWMAAGLALSGVVAWYVLSSEAAYNTAQGWFFPLIIGELVLVLGLSATLHKLSAAAAAFR